jgi:hypothetical protein
MRINKENFRAEWSPSTELIGHRQAMKHKLTKELGLFGKRGHIWLHSDTSIKVVTYYPEWDKVETKGIEELEKECRRLDIPKLSKFQVGYADKVFLNSSK